MIRVSGVIIPAIVLIMACAVPAGAQVRVDSLPRVRPAPLQDTLYVLGDMFIEIRLNEQMLYRYLRNDSVYAYPVSTGDPKQKLAIATREGIFSVQWKAQRHVSSKFDVPMLYWMPFDEGIGIHALEGDSYYWYLGSEPSSHGCVRASREAAEELFASMPVGTPVIVHSGSPARVLEFGDTTRMTNLRIMRSIDADLLNRRLKAVQKGRGGDPSLRERLALPSRVFSEKIRVGKLEAGDGGQAAMQQLLQPPQSGGSSAGSDE
jgi:hypothetical protein